MRLARGTPAPLFVLLVIALLPRRLAVRLAAVTAVGATLSFFRDPERAPDGPGVLAPADGRIRAVSEQDGRWSVSTYLSLRDVHVTRAPCDAVITSADYRPGRFRPAFSEASSENQRLHWTLSTDAGPAELTQFSGSIARRIVPYHRTGAGIARGRRIGLIRFGSRVDVLLPAGASPTVTVGERVRAGRTVIAAGPVTGSAAEGRTG